MKPLSNPMKHILFLLALTNIAHATPPVLSLAQVALQKVDPEIKPDDYDITRGDINDDGTEDLFVLMNDKSGYAGSGGTTLFVLKGYGDRFEALGKTTTVRTPIYLRESRHKGYLDLLVSVSGGGAVPGLSPITFDGTSYSDSPGDERVEKKAGDKLLFADVKPFEQTLTLQGITFKVTSPNNPEKNQVTITPSGLENDNTPITMDAAGPVKGAETGDLNADGSPEIYVYAGDSLIAYSANKKKSLSQITLPELGENAKGHLGGDEFSVLEGVLGRRFPIYPEDKTKSEPTGKIRQIQYKLAAGEAGWLLKVDKVMEF